MAGKPDSYALKTLKERLEYLQNRAAPSRPNTERHTEEIMAAIKVLTEDQRLNRR